MDILQKNVDISNLSNFKTKAKTRYFYEIDNIDKVCQLKSIFSFARKEDLQILIVWWWTNLLFAFDYFNWIVIKNDLNDWFYDLYKKELKAYSNACIWQIAEKLEYNFGQNIWHRFIWLPWSVWWAVVGNAWCFWLETENNFKKAEVYDIINDKVINFDKDEMDFWYRNSFLKKNKNYFLLSAEFDLSEKIEKYSSNIDNIYFRKYKQPSWNSCWSFFKNPSKDMPAGKLIEEVWLKWYSYKTAFFSEKHANFLMTNTDWWDYKDLLYLIELGQKKVKSKFDIDLMPEVNIIKNI